MHSCSVLSSTEHDDISSASLHAVARSGAARPLHNRGTSRSKPVDRGPGRCGPGPPEQPSSPQPAQPTRATT